MIIDDERYAAAMIVSLDDRTEPRRFDDIGDMRAHALANPDLEILRWYVHDHDSLEWIDAEGAHFVRADPLRFWTPMGYGLAAFEDPARAEELAAEIQGELLDFTELVASVEATGHDGR